MVQVVDVAMDLTAGAGAAKAVPASRVVKMAVAEKCIFAVLS